MADVLMDWPGPDRLEQSRRRRRLTAQVALAAVALVAATALVHGFDIAAQRASTAQAVASGYPLYPAACACGHHRDLPLPDWRSLTVWALAMATALTSGWLGTPGRGAQPPR